MNKMFEPVTLGGLSVKNCLIRSATLEMGGARDGVIAPFLGDIYEQLAKGGAGLIITGMMGVSKNCRTLPDMVNTEEESFVPRLSDITRRVHEYGGKICVQLAHCGVKSAAGLDGALPLGPSQAGGHSCEATGRDLKRIVRQFAQAAYKCRQANADAVQLHAAHGYLLSEFLSPYYNKRADEYGGALQNRARLLYEGYAAVRAETGNGFPVLVKINYSDLTQPGFTGEECISVCRTLYAQGLDAAEISSGIGVSEKAMPAQPVRNEEDEAYFCEGAQRTARLTGMPVISVGGYRTPGVIEGALQSGDIAAVSMCRPFIREPNLVRRWESGDTNKAFCISCGRCSRVKTHGCPVQTGKKSG